MAACQNCNTTQLTASVTCPECGAELKPRTRARLPVWAIIAVLLIGGLAWGAYRVVDQSREMSRVLAADCRLKLFGSGVHNFHGQHGHLPPRNLPSLTKDAAMVISPTEVPQSFFTDLLPFVSQPTTYAQVDATLPWKNPANKAAFGTVVSNYLYPSVANPPRSDEGYALAHYATNSKVICDTKTARISEITDGTSNTVLVGMVNDGYQPWADPTNYRDPSKGFGGGPEAFGTPNRNGIVHFLKADGSVLRIRSTLPLELCERLGDPRDGKPLKDLD